MDTNEESKDLDGDSNCEPIDLEAFESLKALRNEQKNANIAWINNFKDQNGRDPSDEELDEIREQIESYNLNNNKYIVMKYQMIRQGIIPFNFVNSAANQKTTTAFKPSTFQDAFFADAEVNRLRADILKMEKSNLELEDEIERLRYNLLDKVTDAQKVDGIQSEIIKKEEQMKEKNELLDNLNNEKAIIEQEKAALKNEMEQLKIKQILVKNMTVLNKQNAEKDAERERELTDLQEQNAQLREQVVALQQLQIQTVTGGSFLETREDMEELPKTALVRDEEMELLLRNERSSESIIASYIQRFELLVQSAEAEADAAAEEERDATPLLSAGKSDVAEDEPQVVDLSAALEEEEAPVVREVVEAGTNMSVTPDHDEVLERERLHEQELEEAREDAAAKQQSINQLNDQMVMLEHAVFDREQEMLDQNNRHHMERTKDFFENQEAKAKLQKNIDELEQAIR